MKIRWWTAGAGALIILLGMGWFAELLPSARLLPPAGQSVLAAVRQIRPASEPAEIALCSRVSGDGRCTPQPYGAYAPGARVWARLPLAGLARDGERVDIELEMEVQGPGGQVVHRGMVVSGPHAAPGNPERAYATMIYDLPEDAAHGPYVLRLALHDRVADARRQFEQGFEVGVKQTVQAQAAVELDGRNLAAQLTAHGFCLANEIAGQQAPQGQLFLIVDTTWRSLLTDRVYGVRLDMLISATIDGQLDYPYADLGRTLEGALPSLLLIDPGQQTRGWVAFVVPARFTSATLRYRDDVIGKGDILLPLVDLEAGDELDFPEAGTGSAAALPVGAGGPVELDETEDNNSARNSNALPAAESLIIHGALADQKDQDWYQLTVRSDEPMLWTFELDAIPDVDAMLSLHQQPGGRILILDDGGMGESERVSDVALPAGDYTLLVSSRGDISPDAPYRLVVRMTGPLREGQEHEINNKLDTANPIAVGETIRGWLGYRRDQDWFRLHVDEETRVAFTISPSPGLDLIVAFHDGEGRRQSLLNVGGPGQPEQQSLRLAAGDHYLAISGDHDPRRPYTLSALPIPERGLNQDLEDNDELARANPIESGAIVHGSLFSGDQDWYAIENATEREQVVKALVWDVEFSTPLTLHAPDGSKISEGDHRTTYVVARVPPGYTYLQVKGQNTNYQLSAWLDDVPPVAQPRDAAQIGLDSLLPSAVGWQTRHNCFGCHVQSMAIVGGALGRENGYQIQDNALGELVEYIQGLEFGGYDYGGAGPLSSIVIHGMALAAHEERVQPGDPDDLQALATAAEILAREQRSDGRWTHSRIETPVQQGDIQVTADAIAVLRRAPGDWSAQIAQAATFLASARPETTQDHVYRVIGLSLLDTSAVEAEIYGQVDELLAAQNEDGGWGEVPSMGSSPYATGQALYGLKLAGVAVSDSRFEAGVRWLVDRQDWTGQWLPENSSAHNPTRASAFPPTMWATIGLAGTLESIDVEITAPQAGDVIEGPVTITARAEPAGVVPVTEVAFSVDDVLLCLDESAPFECAWTAPTPATAHKVKAVARDAAGRTGENVLLTAPLEGEGTMQVLLAPDAERPVPPNIEIVLDASGSMLARIEDGAARPQRIEVAREVLQTLFNELPGDVQVALRVYGHQHDYRDEVCDDTALLVALSPLDRAGLMAQIDGLNPQGMTPIGYTLAQVGEDLSAAQGQSVVVLVSDGEETCEADPCKIADEMVAGGLDAQVHVVGFAVQDPAIAGQLACIAEVTGGSYLPAGSAEQLIAALRAAVTVEYTVLDRDGLEAGRGAVGGEPLLLPAGAYRVEIGGRAPLSVDNVRIRGDQHTTLTLTAAGTIQVQEP